MINAGAYILSGCNCFTESFKPELHRNSCPVFLRGTVDKVQQCCTQRGARMQRMKEWMDVNDHEDSDKSCWEIFLYDECDEPESWFDKDGVPK